MTKERRVILDGRGPDAREIPLDQLPSSEIVHCSMEGCDEIEYIASMPGLWMAVCVPCAKPFCADHLVFTDGELMCPGCIESLKEQEAA